MCIIRIQNAFTECVKYYQDYRGSILETTVIQDHRAHPKFKIHTVSS